MDRPFRALVIRHGRTAYNRAGLFRGRLDIPLDEVGLEQARRIGELLAGAGGGGWGGGQWGRVTAIYTSPMTRARQTAAPLVELTSVNAVCEERLDDVDAGAWQGQSEAEVKALYPGEYQTWQTDPAGFTFPGGESLRAVQERVMAFIGELASKHPGQTIALFSHRVPVKLLIAGILTAGPEAFWRVRVDNGSLTVAEFDGRDLVLTLVNSTAHLAAPDGAGAGGGLGGGQDGAGSRTPDF